MKQYRPLTALILGLALSLPAQAAEPAPLAGLESLLTPQVLLGGSVSDQDVSLLFAHWRTVMLASAEGREPPPMPAALSRRLEAVGGELRIRGMLAVLVLSHVLERRILDAIRDFAPPPAVTQPEQGLQ